MPQNLDTLLRSAGRSENTGDQLAQLVRSGAEPQSGTISGILNDFVQQVQKLTNATEISGETISANTAAVVQSTTSTGSTASDVFNLLEHTGTSLFGGLLNAFPLASTIASLFSGAPSAPTPLVKYQPPPSQSFNLAISNGQTGDAVDDQSGAPRLSSITELALGSVLGSPPPKAPVLGPPTGESRGGFAPQITVQVQALDSRSFIDRSHDIAAAVRDAMLNMQSINDVVRDL